MNILLRFRLCFRICALLASLSVGAPSFGLPILSEIFYDAAGPDGAAVFTEIVGEPGFELESWRLVGVNGATGLPYRTIDLSAAVIPPDGVLVIATRQAEGALLALRDFTADVDWQNGPDLVELWTPLGLRADALQYGDTGMPPLGEGVPAIDVDAGLALARRHGTLDTDDNATDFLAGDPTPGALPGPVPRADAPEPSSTGLLALLLGVPLLAARSVMDARNRRAR